MTNIQNPINLQAVQNNIPVQNNFEGGSVQNIQNKIPVCQPVQPINYMPRYMPLVQNGQVYPAPLPQQTPQYPKSGSVGAVNITINGVNSPMQGTTAPLCAPVPVPYYLSQPLMNPVNNKTQEIKKEVQEPQKEPEQAKLVEKKEDIKPEIKNNKPVIELTDAYIQQLEHKLNNKDKNERAHAVAELVNRFKEDKTRKDDPILTTLLNLALQDDSKPIVFAAMQAIENGYANGNEKTEQYLQAIRNQQDKFGNSETAENLLMKMSERQTDAKKISATDIPGQKLNLMAG